ARSGSAHGDGGDREWPGWLRRLAELHLYGWRGERELSGDDHVVDGGHDGGVGDGGYPGERRDDHADDRHGREHGCRWLGERVEVVGEREDRDRAECDE